MYVKKFHLFVIFQMVIGELKENRRKEIIEQQQKLFGEDPKELEKLYSDEFVLSIDKFPLNVIEWHEEI